ncbi:MAG: hypothetical protein DMD28_07530 [Gemmatimonadetes bacterium]|nr:MAG: hypothetical protein DMD28_07530 [Gemmatimonadota bacterium]
MRVWCLIGGLWLAACAHGPQRIETRVQDPKADLSEALALFRRGDFNRALIGFRRVQFELAPTQPEVAEARYFIAECDFQLGDRATAALEFRKVADDFPDSEYAPLALLRAGDANLRLWRRPELDPEPGQTALATYQELQGRYPGTDAAARAQLHVSQLNEWFAEKNYKNGMFYFRRRAYDSAIIYFKDVIANYPGTRLVPDALLRLVDSYRAIRYIEELKEACANLRQYYPKTDGLAARCPAETGNPARSSGTP